MPRSIWWRAAEPLVVSRLAKPPNRRGGCLAQGDEGDAKLFIAGNIEGDREHSQKLAKTYFPSGAVWALDCKAFRAQRRIYCEPLRMVMMDYERSIDIDDEADIVVADSVGISTLQSHHDGNKVVRWRVGLLKCA